MRPLFDSFSKSIFAYFLLVIVFIFGLTTFDLIIDQFQQVGGKGVPDLFTCRHYFTGRLYDCQLGELLSGYYFEGSFFYLIFRTLNFFFAYGLYLLFLLFLFFYFFDSKLNRVSSRLKSCFNRFSKLIGGVFVFSIIASLLIFSFELSLTYFTEGNLRDIWVDVIDFVAFYSHAIFFLASLSVLFVFMLRYCFRKVLNFKQ